MRRRPVGGAGRGSPRVSGHQVLSSGMTIVTAQVQKELGPPSGGRTVGGGRGLRASMRVSAEGAVPGARLWSLGRSEKKR